MITSEVVSYIQTERAKGTSDAVIKSNLLANGWSDGDITQALAPAGSTPVPQALSSEALAQYQKKALWSTFTTLVIIDAMIIIMSKSILNSWGMFGISPVSVLVRLLVIYSIAAFAARGHAPTKDGSMSISQIVARIFGAIIVTIIVLVGAMFFLCLYSFR